MKKILIIGSFIILSFIIIFNFKSKTDYIEMQTIGDEFVFSLEMDDNNDIIEQEFEIPYNTFLGLGFFIDPCERENDVDFKFVIMDKAENKQIAEKNFNVKNVKNITAYNVFLDKPVHIDKTHKFSVIITPINEINEDNMVRFYVGSNNIENYSLYYNTNLDDRSLSLNIYGGERSKGFWTIFTIICESYLIILFGYMLYLSIKQKPLPNSFKKYGKSSKIIFCNIFSLIIS